MRLWQIDAFTDRPFTGNPACVCLLEEERDADWMQRVAAEMNLAETAFLRQRAEEAANAWDLRWFTPLAEVPLCGHATLASAHALWEWIPEDAGALFFGTRSGRLTAERHERGIQLDFPCLLPGPLPAGHPALAADWRQLLGAAPRQVQQGGGKLLVEVATVEEVQGLQPDFAALRRLPEQGVIVTAAAPPGADYDFVSRYFAPRVGVPEDPVTGSAHCVLAPFWQRRLHREVLQAWQASPRGGRLEVELTGDRVQLRGRAVTVFEAELLV